MPKRTRRKKQKGIHALSAYAVCAHAIQMLETALQVNKDLGIMLKELLRLHRMTLKVQERAMKDALKRLKEVPRETQSGPTM